MSSPPRCALKVDLRKAYDTVEWDFLIATLRMFGFPAIFIRWIEECVTSAHYSVVVNGGVHGFFAGARGLRQGDPMSPYLFVLVMEVLHMILQQLIEQDGEFKYLWRCQELNLFQLSFADDLLLLCKADVRSVNLFRQGLDRFATLSGLNTNPQKSHLIISKALRGSVIHCSRHWGSRRANFRSDTLVFHLFQHGFLSQIVNHCFRRLTAASKDGRSPAFLCWPGPTYQICFDLLRGVLGYGIYFAEGDYQRDDEAITYFPLERSHFHGPTRIGNMVFNGRHPDGVESMWLMQHFDLYWLQLSTTYGRNAMQGDSNSVVDHPRLWAGLLWRRLDRGSSVSL
ncbi:Retrovirus-related Pol polyprotein from type-2 retrotransposable element R2DM [Sesamum angolense]|uniref:Retrovirus-related Pol polyprotein from type-2 retrotransposable element R2DM n=1 Tax=Sesamum angolense TaxID=2727404 RepID=A0AAE1T9K8_9LAMI|nr:Retrovirus-related Pol polyprotein from type-2 retrotransposable element R2DM [Sesamum angolense]